MKRTALRTSAPTQGCKVTDYFTRISGDGPSSSPSRPRNPQQHSLQNPTESTLGAKATETKKEPPEREVITVSSDSHVSVSSGSVIYVSKSSRVPRTRLRRTVSAASNNLACLKQRASARKSAPDVSSPIHSRASQILKPYSASQRAPATTSLDKSKFSAKRKKKFDSDSDVEILHNVIYVPRATKSKPVSPAPVSHVSPLPSKQDVTSSNEIRTPPKKKQRLSEPSSRTTVDLIPSSQSDEHEFAPPPKIIGKSVEEVSEIVERWREATLVPPDGATSLQDDALPLNAETKPFASLSPPVAEADVEMPVMKDSSPSSAETLSNNLHEVPVVQSLKSFIDCPVTPPRTKSCEQQTEFGVDISLPATPEPLDAESKTAQIIAQIKANAFQTRCLSPEDETLPEFNDLAESSDESDDDLPSWGRLNAAKANRSNPGPFSSPLTSIASAKMTDDRAQSPSPFRYALRSRSQSKVTPPIALKERKGSIADESSKPPSKPSTRKRVQDPLEMLLKEKKKAEKAGKGIEALRLAEAAVADQDPNQDWADEAAALIAVREGRVMGYTSDDSLFGSPAGSTNGSLPEAADRARLLGEDRERAICNILVKDKGKRGKQTAQTKVPGVFLWEEDWEMDDRIETNSQLPSWMPSSTEDASPFLNGLKNALERGEIAHAKLLMNSGVLAAPHSRMASVASFLFGFALSVHPIAETAFHILLHHLDNRHKTNIPLSLVLTILRHLGAKSSVFQKAGWVVTEVRDDKLKFHARANIVYRLVTILTVAARAGALSHNEIPDFLMVLQLLTIDPLTTSDIRRDLTVAVDIICQSLDLVDDGANEIEIQICNRLLGFASDLTPINLALFVSSFAGGGCSRTLRIARWLAHCMLLQNYNITLEQYCDLPPLSGVIELLSLSLESDGLFSIDSTTDYEDVGYYVDILSVALSDIEAYVVEELRSPPPEISSSQDMGMGSPKKGEKSKPLQIIQRHIEKIYAMIVDTRAAHLDRSRTKAALQRLALRIFYQRLTVLKSGDKTRSLLNWIKK